MAQPGRIVPAPIRSASRGYPSQPSDTADAGANLVQPLIRALEARDPYTLGHSMRVGRIARAIAMELGLSTAAQSEIERAGQLHDIGKIGIADELLKSQGSLTHEQHQQILTHTVIGERILEPLYGERPVVLGVVRWHHERYGGSGYPDGLAGEAIPLPARIVCVADAYDAMTSARPYRDALPVKVATWELANGAGLQFDPMCVAALLTVVGREAKDRRRAQRERRVRTLGQGRFRLTPLQSCDRISIDSIRDAHTRCAAAGEVRAAIAHRLGYG